MKDVICFTEVFELFRENHDFKSLGFSWLAALSLFFSLSAQALDHDVFIDSSDDTSKTAGLNPSVHELSQPVGPTKVLDVVFGESVLAFPAYVSRDGQGRLAGTLIDLWDCVFDQAGVVAEYRVLPNARALHEVLSGKADFHGARVSFGHEVEVPYGELYYTDLVAHVYEVVVARRADQPLLADALWWRQRVAAIRAEMTHPKVEVLGGRVAVFAESLPRALKLLVGNRVDVVLHASTKPGEALTNFYGHDLVARSLSQFDGRGLLSAARHRKLPELLARINRGLPACQSLLSDEFAGTPV